MLDGFPMVFRSPNHRVLMVFVGCPLSAKRCDAMDDRSTLLGGVILAVPKIKYVFFSGKVGEGIRVRVNIGSVVE